MKLVCLASTVVHLDSLAQPEDKAVKRLRVSAAVSGKTSVKSAEPVENTACNPDERKRTLGDTAKLRPWQEQRTMTETKQEARTNVDACVADNGVKSVPVATEEAEPTAKPAERNAGWSGRSRE